ncbi:MAG: hypothetical protein EXQ94_09300 [Alphaproteobacteria bacterium]|nr:hypothetical protein [Alphaproteobacteria bacterium]
MSLDLARIAEVCGLLDELAGVATRLLPNEREMVAHLRAKYAEPGHTDADDVPVLRVILRNVTIRGGFDIDPARDPGRVIPVTPRR